MNHTLLLTLGHNSSAIYVDGITVIGYEEERLNKKKSSSDFPELSIKEILKRLGRQKFDNNLQVLVSHWFDDFSLNENKYWKPEVLKQLCGSYVVIGVNNEFTHHDAHAYSSLAFFNERYFKEFPSKTVIKQDEYVHFIVADGFGNNGEVLSIYRVKMSEMKNNNLKLIHRSYGYENSLGLMYQYATSFTGMKENQDEYKYLGYESHINEVLSHSHEMDYLNCAALSESDAIFKDLIGSFIEDNKNHDGLIDVGRLMKTKNEWHRDLARLIHLSDIQLGDFDTFQVRTVVAYYIQSIIEDVLIKLIDHFNIKHVVLSGGIFYNVKLNNRIMKHVKGVLSVIPLAGDQGAAIGMYQKFVGNFKFGDMCWGKRNIKIHNDVINNVFVFKNEDDAINKIVDLLESDRVINVVRGDMEFGPRALCNTSSIMLPFSENVKLTNSLNDRNEVMPCAPFMHEKSVGEFFDKENYKKVIGSDKFMIITYDYKDEYSNEDPPINIDGVMHKYPLEEKFSGRPQLVSEDSFAGKILSKSDWPVLVNTSFNVHGRPIVYSNNDIIENYNFQLQKAKEKGIDKPNLVVVNGE